MESDLSILVLYDLKDIKPYICLSNFLCLCGIVVEGKRLGFDEVQMNEDEVEKYICTVLLSGNHEINKSSIPLLKISPCMQPNANNQTICRHTISETLKLMQTHWILSIEKLDAMKIIAKVYGEKSLRVHEYNFQHYFYDKDSMQTACYNYRKAEEELFDQFKELKRDGKLETALLVQYARCFCAVRVVVIEKQYEFSETYDISLVKRGLQNLFDEDETMVLVYWLLAQLCEAQEKTIEAFEYYNQYLEICGRKKGAFVSDVLYRQGKILEEKEERKRASQYFENSLACNKNNYRAEYKVIDIAEFIEKQYVWAIKKYQNMIQKFKTLMEYGYLQPMELEYLFKLYFRCGRLYARRMPDMDQALKYFQKAEEMAGVTLEQMGFMTAFYGKDAQSYLTKTEDRFPMYQIKINKQEVEWNQG